MRKSHTTKRSKLIAFGITLLIAAYIAPLCIAYGGPCNCPEIPGGIPSNAVQCNKTDTTPVCETEQIKAGELALFYYRNMTMLMNCTQNCALVVTVDPDVTPKILGLSIDPNQTMMLTMNMYCSPLQGEMAMERTLNFYLGIEPNATSQLNAQIRLHINQTVLNQELNREVNASRLTWMYWNRTGLEWVPVYSYMDQNGYLTCNTNHFSTWTIAEIAPTKNSASTQWNWTTYAVMGAVVAPIAVALIVAIIRRR